MASLIFFSCKKARQTKSFCLRMVKNRQHQHKGKPHTQGKFQDAAISVKEVIQLFRGLTYLAPTVDHCHYNMKMHTRHIKLGLIIKMHF